jgi:CheY-like chemotaxis protein
MMFREHTQYGLLLARDGEEAVEKAIAEQPNLVLMDVIMPKMNGFEACREMRKHEASAQSRKADSPDSWPGRLNAVPH